MPTIPNLIAVAMVAGCCAIVVVLTLHLVGLGQHAPIAAGVSAATSAVVASQVQWRNRMRRARALR